MDFLKYGELILAYHCEAHPSPRVQQILDFSKALGEEACLLCAKAAQRMEESRLREAIEAQPLSAFVSKWRMHMLHLAYFVFKWELMMSG